MSQITRFPVALKELRIHLCQTSEASSGLRNFIQEYYVPVKTENPKLPILIRECSGAVPKIWARFERGREVDMNVSNLPASEILKRLNSMISCVILFNLTITLLCCMQQKMANRMSAGIIRFCDHFVDLRIHYCPQSYGSRGTKEFIYKYLPIIRENNPDVPIFVGPCCDIEPWMWARFKWGRHKKLRLNNLQADQVLCVVEEMSQGGVWGVGSRWSTKTYVPRGYTLLPREQKSRNPFEVLSKL
ncbi:NADH dehydrogenase [ubiquinone] 1 alpha subcomplex subunit 2 [Trichinella pseudospiralis]|uniref:NADH dehydrogenase [ubiquinone] 1 alpha subcomplex subunit 2 n=1 Tax=Trichinella pseudospiralis TaxID=6337 RepID=A0A0V1FG11_TRIPS|nr:NADH dehydrogenase [ubiquinone] 1 alpha subcomplex subunit 2 [Trichinella pseudospiralis]